MNAGQELKNIVLVHGGFASRLFLSPRTVSTHLYQVFPKLGITSRAALRDALADVPPELSATRLDAGRQDGPNSGLYGP